MIYTVQTILFLVRFPLEVYRVMNLYFGRFLSFCLPILVGMKQADRSNKRDRVDQDVWEKNCIFFVVGFTGVLNLKLPFFILAKPTTDDEERPNRVCQNQRR